MFKKFLSSQKYFNSSIWFHGLHCIDFSFLLDVRFVFLVWRNCPWGSQVLYKHFINFHLALMNKTDNWNTWCKSGRRIYNENVTEIWRKTTLNVFRWHWPVATWPIEKLLRLSILSKFKHIFVPHLLLLIGTVPPSPFCHNFTVF